MCILFLPLLLRRIRLTDNSAVFVTQDQDGELLDAVDRTVALRNVIESSAKIGVSVFVVPNGTVVHSGVDFHVSLRNRSAGFFICHVNLPKRFEQLNVERMCEVGLRFGLIAGHNFYEDVLVFHLLRKIKLVIASAPIVSLQLDHLGEVRTDHRKTVKVILGKRTATEQQLNIHLVEINFDIFDVLMLDLGNP